MRMLRVSGKQPGQLGDTELAVNTTACSMLDMNKNRVNIKEELNVYFNLKV